MSIKRILFLSLILLFFCSSCFKDSNFEFEVPETRTIVTTSKREKGHFFIFFTEKGATISTEPSNDVDYIELRTEKAATSLIFNPGAPKQIYLLNTALILRANEVKYAFRYAYDAYADSTFYDRDGVDKKGEQKGNKALKKPYIGFDIDMMRYNIERSNDKKTLKEGGLFGGW